MRLKHTVPMCLEGPPCPTKTKSRAEVVTWTSEKQIAENDNSIPLRVKIIGSSSFLTHNFRQNLCTKGSNE